MQAIKKGYAFDDVLIRPRYSEISPRDTVVATRFSRNIKLNIPIVSANMDTVTEWKMAHFMAQAGGIGIIHRWCSIEEEAEMARKVKRIESAIIDVPYTINANVMTKDASDLMSKRGVSGFPVVDEKKRVIGIITKSDIQFAKSLSVSVKGLMTEKVITAKRGISMEEAKKILIENRIEKLPLMNEDRTLSGLITLKDINRSKNENAAKDIKGRLLVGAAIGSKDEALPRAEALVEAGADVLVIDIAHGHSKAEIETIKLIRKKFPDIEIGGGNVATREGVRDLIRAGADAVKVGIGPGAACTTRTVTGVGVPQLSAIIECSKEAKKYHIPVIADGGIKNSGDVAKAIGAGASTVMIGSLLAGTDESPGEYELEDGKAYKRYRGMASREATEDKMRLDGNDENSYRVPEGKPGKVFYKGAANKVLWEIVGALRQSMGYVGAKTLPNFARKAQFKESSAAGLKESQTRLE